MLVVIGGRGRERAPRREEQIRAMRSALEAALQMLVTIDAAAMTWMVRHAAWVLMRFQGLSNGFTAHMNGKKRACNGDVAQFCVMVMLQEAGEHMEKPDDRWLGPVLWLGKSDQGDELWGALHGGKALATGRSIRRLQMRSRWSVDAVGELQITPWETTDQGRERAGTTTQAHHEPDVNCVRTL